MTNALSTFQAEYSISNDIANNCNSSDVGELQEMEEIDLLHRIEDQHSARSSSAKKRRKRWLHIRIDWVKHVQKLEHERMFVRTYGMPLVAFQNLVSLLSPIVMRNTSRSRSSQPISVELIVAVGMRYLRGGEIMDIKNVYGLSKTHAYRSRNCFLKAVLQCDSLKIKMPSTAEEWEAVRRGFHSKSSGGIVHGCVGALDGYLQQVVAPKKKEVGGNVLAFFSGHYLVYGINCQAMCDADLKFLYFGVVAPGRTNDNVAIDRSEGLLELINSLPQGLFVVGDAAYTLMEHLLIPFVGCMRDDPDRDAYNFHISQLRIRIEMALGRLVSKFGILRSKMKCSLKTTTKALMVCARLYNYIIDWSPKLNNTSCGSNANTINEGDLSVKMGPNGMEYLPSLPESFVEMEGHSQIRQSLLDAIKANKVRRPNYNIVRNMDRHANDSFHGIPPEYFNPR